MINPFSPTFPVNPRYFVNREDIISSFEKGFARSSDRLELPTPDNFAILGDWGVGKTSVLCKFEDISLKFKDRKAFSTIVELIPSSCDSFASLVKKTIDDIERSFTVRAPIAAKIRDQIKRWRINSIGFGTGPELERRIREKDSASVLQDGLIEFWRILEKSGIEVGLIMFDDLHYLLDSYPEGLYDLRGVFQGLPKYGCNFIVCATGRSGLFSEIRELAEPLSRFFNIKHHLNSFDYEETKEAILRPIALSRVKMTLEEEALREIYALTDGHPFFIHFIMRELVSLKEKDRIDLAEFNNSWAKIKKIIEREKFEVDFLMASEKEREILLAISRLESLNFTPSMIEIKNARTRMRHLLEKNLIKRHERGEYSLYHPLFREYLRTLV